MARVASALLAIIAVCACAAGCGGDSEHATAPSASPGGFDGAALAPGTVAPRFTLTDQQGRRVSLAGYRGRVVVLAFVYSRCGASCVLVAQQVRGALDELANRPATVFMSADPGRDDAASVARFLARVSLAGRVAYLSGPTRPLRAALAAYHVPPPRGHGAFEPPASLVLIDGRGHERVVFGLEQLTPEALAHDVRTLQAG